MPASVVILKSKVDLNPKKQYKLYEMNQATLVLVGIAIPAFLSSCDAPTYDFKDSRLHISSFPEEIALNAIDFSLEDEVITPYSLDIIEGVAIVGGYSKSGNWINAFDLGTGKIIYSAFPEGEGPSESKYISSVGITPTGKLYLHDQSRVLFLDFDSLKNSHHPTFSYKNIDAEMSLGSRSLYSSRMTYMQKFLYVSSNVITHSARFSTFDTSFTKASSFGNYSNVDSLKYQFSPPFVTNTLGNIFDADIIKLDKNHIISRSYYLGLLEIFELGKDKPKFTVISPEQSFPLEFENSGQRGSLKTVTCGYFDFKVYKKQIFALYSKKPYKGLSAAKHVHVFDKEGIPKVEIILDKPLSCIAIWDDKLYGFHVGEPSGITIENYEFVYYQLPNI